MTEEKIRKLEIVLRRDRIKRILRVKTQLCLYEYQGRSQKFFERATRGTLFWCTLVIGGVPYLGSHRNRPKIFLNFFHQKP